MGNALAAVVVDKPADDHQGQTIQVAPPAAPLPVFLGVQMVQALTAYKDLQSALDRAMPDQLMAIASRVFRKKGYWRAIAVAFNLDVTLESEQRTVEGQFGDSRENFGYLVTYRATAPNGRSIVGDGSAFAIEKAARFKCPHPHPKGWKGKTEHWPAESCPSFDPEFKWKRLPSEATVHNVRSHAHTRAFNRAVSNLVGFGEVSAEEIERDAAPAEDFIVGEDAPPMADEPAAQIRRIALTPGTFQILSVRSLRYGGEARIVDDTGTEALYQIPDRQCVQLCEAIAQEFVAVTMDRVKSRTGTLKIKAVHRVPAKPLYDVGDLDGGERAMAPADAPILTDKDIPF